MFTLTAGGETVQTINDCREIKGVYNFGDNDFLVLYISGDNYCIAVTDGDNINIYDTEVSCIDNAVSFAGRYLYFFHNTREDDLPVVKICRYDCDYNIRRYSVINTDIQIMQNWCAADSSGNYYFISGREVIIYRNNIPDARLYIDDVPSMLVPSYNADGVFCMTCGNITAIDNSGKYEIPVRAENIYPAGNGFSDSFGTVYSYDGVVLCDSFSGKHGSVTSNGAYFGISGDRLVQIYNEKETVICSMSEQAFLCMGNDRFISVVQSGSGAEIRFFDNKPKEPVVSNSGSTDNSDISSSVNLDSFAVKDGFLCGISPESTIAEIKRLLDPKNCAVGFYGSDNTEKKSGTVGTGYDVRITGENTQSYTIIIYGDLSGEGGVNTTDRRMLMKYFLHGEDLSGDKQEAADLNHDKKVDLIDITELNMYINGNGNISQNPYQ